MDKPKDYVFLGVLLVLLIAAFYLLITLNIQLFSKRVVDIGPNALARVTYSEIFFVETPINLTSNNNFVIINEETHDIFDSSKILPALGEDRAHFVFTNLASGKYSVDYDVAIYTLEPATVVIRNKIPVSILSSIFLLFGIGILYIFLAWAVLKLTYTEEELR